MVDKHRSLRDTKPVYRSEAFLNALDVAALGPAQNLESYISDWQDWLTLRVKAGEISAATRNAYTRGAKQYFSYTEGCDPTDLETFRAWKTHLLERYGRHTAYAWLAGVRSFVNWRAETQRFL